MSAEPRYASESWRWVQGDEEDPGQVWHLVAGEGPLPGPRVILECGNIDAEDMDLIAQAPKLERSCRSLTAGREKLKIAIDMAIGLIDDGAPRLARRVLEKAGGEGELDA